MKHEWDDFLGVRVRVRQRPQYQRLYRTAEFQPSGWGRPGVKRAVSIYWRVTITIIKMLVAIPLSLMVVGSIWMLWVLVTLPFK